MVADFLQGLENETPVFGEVQRWVFEFAEFAGWLFSILNFSVAFTKKILSHIRDISDFDGLLINSSSIEAVGIDDIAMVFEFLNDDIITTITLSPNFFTSSTCPA